MHVSGFHGRTEKAREMIEGSRIRDSFGDPESPGASGHGSLPSGNDCYIAIENGPFIVDLPIKNGDVP